MLKRNKFLLSSNLDEFLQQLDTFAEGWAQAHLCHHPQLDLIKMTEKEIQICCCFLKMMPPKCMIDQLMLKQRTTIFII